MSNNKYLETLIFKVGGKANALSILEKAPTYAQVYDRKLDTFWIATFNPKTDVLLRDLRTAIAVI